jgi:hypothetical protein
MDRRGVDFRKYFLKFTILLCKIKTIELLDREWASEYLLYQKKSKIFKYFFSFKKLEFEFYINSEFSYKRRI